MSHDEYRQAVLRAAAELPLAEPSCRWCGEDFAGDPLWAADHVCRDWPRYYRWRGLITKAALEARTDKTPPP